MQFLTFCLNQGGRKQSAIENAKLNLNHQSRRILSMSMLLDKSVRLHDKKAS